MERIGLDRTVPKQDRIENTARPSPVDLIRGKPARALCCIANSEGHATAPGAEAATRGWRAGVGVDGDLLRCWRRGALLLRRRSLLSCRFASLRADRAAARAYRARSRLELITGEGASWRREWIPLRRQYHRWLGKPLFILFLRNDYNFLLTASLQPASHPQPTQPQRRPSAASTHRPQSSATLAMADHSKMRRQGASSSGHGTGIRQEWKVRADVRADVQKYRNHRKNLPLIAARLREEQEANMEGYAYRNNKANLALMRASAEWAGLIVFFPGMPGCAKSIICEEVLKLPPGLVNSRPLYFPMKDLTEESYWQIFSEELKKNSSRIFLADINSPSAIKEMCQTSHTAGVPVIIDSEGTISNPYSIEALAVFMFRALGNYLGNMDAASSAVYVLLRFYHLYEGHSRRKFETDLYDTFGSLVKMPLLKAERDPLPDVVQHVLEEGIGLFVLHEKKHRSVTPSEGAYAQDWSQWVEKLDMILVENASHLNSIQVPLDLSMKAVMDQLKVVIKAREKNQVQS
ncbi:hypothetical protein EJB05_47604, partial [Eragrostis curvula]